jgi:hypothetical protein
LSALRQRRGTLDELVQFEAMSADDFDRVHKFFIMVGELDREIIRIVGENSMMDIEVFWQSQPITTTSQRTLGAFEFRVVELIDSRGADCREGVHYASECGLGRDPAERGHERTE